MKHIADVAHEFTQRMRANGPTPVRSTLRGNAPGTAEALLRFNQVVEVVLNGVRTADGMVFLADAEGKVLLLIAQVKLKLRDMVGQLDAASIADELGYRSVRSVQAALAKLQALELITVTRESNRITEILVHPSLWRVRRPKQLETTYAQGEGSTEKAQFFAGSNILSGTAVPEIPPNPPNRQEGVARGGSATAPDTDGLMSGPALSLETRHGPATTATAPGGPGSAPAARQPAFREPDESWFLRNKRRLRALFWPRGAPPGS